MSDDALRQFIASLPAIPWFASVGKPTDRDDQLVRVGLDDVLRLHEDPWRLWGELLPRQEQQLDQLVLEHRRLREDGALQRAATISGPAADDFLTSLVDRFPGEYGDTGMHAYELFTVPDRLVRYAARELLVRDVAPELHFFSDLMDWFRRGHFPVGWEGAWPGGKLVLF